MSHPAQDQQNSAAEYSQAPLQQQNGHLSPENSGQLPGRASTVKAEPVAVKKEHLSQPVQTSGHPPAQQLPQTFAKGTRSLVPCFFSEHLRGTLSCAAEILKRTL